MKSGTTDLIQKILTAGEGMIRDGSFLITSSDMIEDQKGWCDEDPAKDMDFSTSSFWITTDDGAEPEGIDDDAELLENFTDLLVIEKKLDYSDVESMTGKFVYFKDQPVGEFPDDTVSVCEKDLERLLVNLMPDECVVFYKNEGAAI